MRCTIAGCSFELNASEVEQAMSGIKPEPVTGMSVRIGRRNYPVKQVGSVITKQDRRDFSATEVARALQRLGFICDQPAAPAAPAPFAELPQPPAARPQPSHPAIAEQTGPEPLPSAIGFLHAGDESNSTH
jgi:hypothetical protein